MPRFLVFAIAFVASGTFSAALLGQTTPTSPPILGGIFGGGAVELGQRVVLQAVFSGTGTGQTYQWRKAGTDISGATASSFVIEAASSADQATYAVTVTNAAGSSVATTEVTVKAAAAPVITTQPRSVVAQVGQAVTFSFIATGSFPRTHQWRKDGVNLSGATSATLALTNISTADAGIYSVQVSNGLGSATSSSASLTVNAATPPVIASFSPGDATFTQGQSVSLYISLSGGSSPFTYQWLKGGAPISGATNAQLTFPAIGFGDAGKYSVTVTNVAGSATSREATVTVNAAAPIVIGRGPESLTVAEGQSARFSVSFSGSSPYTFQWFKNNTAISGATNSNYAINAVASTDAGAYKVSITNVAGSVTSAEGTLTVTPALPPTITRQPASQTVSYRNSIEINVQVDGTPPFTFQWRKDGAAISGATSSSYFSSNATPTQSGVYTVVVTNAVGSVTSQGATITVSAPAVPVITRQPVSREVATGLSTSFTVEVNSTGTGPLTFQWLKNGAPLAAASSVSYGINNVRPADAGDYRVVIAGAGGTVTSAIATLTVLPPAPPSVRSWITGAYNIELGSSGRLSANSVEGTGPFTYQWSKNGTPIPGATNPSLNFSAARADDVGTYTVTISNEGGVLTSPGMRVRVYDGSRFGSNPPPPPWLDVGQVGSVVYFLATLPARIERYDLAAERWLPTTLLSETQVPTAFVAADEGIYIAYGRVLARRPLDLSTETPLTNTPSSVSHLFVLGDYLYYNSGSSSSRGGTYSTMHRVTQQAGPTANLGRFSSGGYRQVSFAPSLRKGFGTSTGVSPSDIEAFVVAADGSTTSSIDSPYHGTMPVGSRTFVFPGDQLVTDDSGTVYRTADLVYAGSFGEAINDLAFFGDGTPVALRGAQLFTTRGDNFVETGRTRIAQVGLRLFTRGSNVFVFGAAATGSNFTVTKVPASDFAPAPTPAPQPVPPNRFSVDDAFLGEGNVVYIFSRTLQGLVRWNVATRSFLTTIPLRDAPGFIFHQPGNPRALAYYPDGVITEIPLRAGGVERAIANIGQHVRAMVDLGDMFTVNFSDWQSSGDDRLIYTPAGPRFVSTNLYNAPGLAWQAAPRRLYSVPAFGGSLQYEIFTTAGTLMTGASNTGSASVTVTPPIRFNPEGTLLVGANGRVLNANLAHVGVLANNIIDSAWLTNGLYTIRSVAGQTEVQHWARVTYLQAGSVTVRGTPVRLLRLSDSQLLVVSSVQGFLTLTLVNADLSVVTPPEVRTLAGMYFAKLTVGSSTGDLALQVRPNGTGTLLVSLPGNRTALFSNEVTVNSDGTFIVSATDLANGNPRTIAGSIDAKGGITGSIPNLNVTFNGSRASGAVPDGFYQAAAINGGVGVAYALVGPHGQAVVAARSGTVVETGSAASDASGIFPLTTSTGAQITFAIDSGAGALTATANRDAFAGITFAGLRDDVARTDRLGNISTRGRAGAGEDAMIAGFVITGTAPRTVLVRAIGPALGNFGVVGAMSDPKLVLFRGGTQMAESDNWSAEASASAIAAAAVRVGAFALPSPGRDAVLLSTLEPGNYTAQVTASTGGGGVSLVEVYDAGADSAAGTPKLINIATRGRVGTGEDVLIAGIVITGNSPKRVLVRAIGPTLATFGVNGALADPVLTLVSGSRTLATNDDWSLGATPGPGEIASAAVGVGAFALPPNSRDACVLITLQPGNYTAQVSGKGSATGVALVEVYEIGN